MPKSGLLFTSRHPLEDTHYLAVEKVDEFTLPNLVSETLPRKDKGDREDYCTTMLTLFQPWRTGLDLKRREESWEEAFQRHQFTEKQIQLMWNFNLKYECLDERDDYHAQLRSGAITVPSWDEAAAANVDFLRSDYSPTTTDGIEECAEQSAFLDERGLFIDVTQASKMADIWRVLDLAGW
ncbi:hypothetical protein EDD18DRAFT_1081562, partial [Armillaria luteobubalina]